MWVMGGCRGTNSRFREVSKNHAYARRILRKKECGIQEIEKNKINHGNLFRPWTDANDNRYRVIGDESAKSKKKNVLEIQLM